ncbi:hypothetical protein DCO48_03920 [Pseudomonas sp. SDI]|uniref:DUF1842 domain-containing protein n=1 Tax=Pseudomonas sp. SDI TaxID=2170734 RepID=UPI000DE79A6D|nr:DUF1842 domain-containing protein [Pseudomonas sp. SDI]PWB35140.1 hypothetical protein DCO48_03920 [Pseudomonas sp. SDI]
MTDSVQAPVGLFPLSYVIGTDAAGAQRLLLDLLVYTPERTVNGHAHITQAINPPLDLQLSAWGSYSYLTVVPVSQGKILITAQGNHGGPTANSIVAFKLHLVVDNDWKTGVASYQYLNNGQWVSVNQVPAKLDSSRIQEAGTVDKQARLHAATQEAAIAGGNLVALRALAGGDAGQALSNAIDSTKTASGKAGKSSRA